MQLDTLFAKSNGLFLFSIFENFPLGGGVLLILETI